ncbi:inorganic pyrophosphatase [Fusarium heterosporum]|uniref:Inorganic pyrophosphatase n=1 Tax=Fusarium heterosporum TaxID=42747 RepID=A0A8H5SP81_FUSHE|nr:inorganic pyrophosphatase [Fusarium heterosporum]
MTEDALKHGFDLRAVGQTVWIWHGNQDEAYFSTTETHQGLSNYSRLLMLQRSLRTTGTGTGIGTPLSVPLVLRPQLSLYRVRVQTPGRANYMSSQAARSPAAAGANSSGSGSGSGTSSSAPPPPSSSSHSTATSTSKISSRRTAQIARHFSSSSSPTGPVQKQKPDMASNYTVRKVAAPNTLEHRVYIEKDGQPVSPFHDIPLYANQEQNILNMVVEIPRWTNAKLEISKEELLNPIKQDIKKGKLRYVRNCFPHKGYLWNYGAFPQTWEDPNSVHPETKAKGDNDPLDVCEIGELVGYVGQVKQVKVLGVMALLDEEETDWKVIVIDVNDPLASKLNDVEDVERHLPGLLRATNEWFRIYKIPDGKPENQFAFTGECKNKSYALDVVRECGEAWERLITGKTPAGGVSTTNVAVQNSPSRVSADQLPPLPANEELPAEKIDASIDKWFFISGASA